MIYFHQSVCISPQHSYPEQDLSQIRDSRNNLLEVVEPDYPGIPAVMKRRMGKSVRLAVGAAMSLFEKNLAQDKTLPDGILIATANGGMEDCIKFLNQIIEFNEGLLTPANFVQSTSNAAAAQIALVTKNHNYNTTHVHRGIAFENAMMDVMMLLKENPNADYLLGCTDEISPYNYNIDRLAGWYRDEPISNMNLFQSPAKGTIAGEGAFMVRVNGNETAAVARLRGLRTIHTKDPMLVTHTMNEFLSANLPGEIPDVLMTGENGDERQMPFYEMAESNFDHRVSVARFKHLCGEYCTASSFACWLSIQIIQNASVPAILLKKTGEPKPVRNILIYNNYRGEQHAFILLSAITQSFQPSSVNC